MNNLKMTSFAEYWKEKDSFAIYDYLEKKAKLEEDELFDQIKASKTQKTVIPTCKDEEESAKMKIEKLQELIEESREKEKSQREEIEARRKQEIWKENWDMAFVGWREGSVAAKSDSEEYTISREIRRLEERKRTIELELKELQSRNNENNEVEKNQKIEAVRELIRELSTLRNGIFQEEDQRHDMNIVVDSEEMRTQYNYMIQFLNDKESREVVRRVFELLILPIRESRLLMIDMATQIGFLQTRDYSIIRKMCKRDAEKLEVAIQKFNFNKGRVEEKLRKTVENGGDLILVGNVQRLLKDMDNSVNLVLDLNQNLKNRIMNDPVARLMEQIQPKLIGIAEVINVDLSNFHSMEDGLRKMNNGDLNAIPTDGDRTSNNTNYQ